MNENFIEKEQFSFEGICVNASTEIMHETFGLSQERGDELRKMIADTFKKKVSNGTFGLKDIEKVGYALKAVEGIQVDTLNEYTFVVVVLLQATYTIQALKNL